MRQQKVGVVDYGMGEIISETIGSQSNQTNRVSKREKKNKRVILIASKKAN